MVNNGAVDCRGETLRSAIAYRVLVGVGLFFAGIPIEIYLFGIEKEWALMRALIWGLGYIVLLIPIELIIPRSTPTTAISGDKEKRCEKVEGGK